MKLLITAFEPFNKKNTNVSLEVLNRLEHDLKICLPVTYKDSREKLKEAIDKYDPDFVLSLGEAGGEDKIRVEKFGLNYQRASIPDNANVLKLEGKITDGPLAYESIVHVEELVDKIKEVTPCYLSLSAGGFICNTTYYSALEFMHGNALFIHLPYYNGQMDSKIPSLDLDLIVKSVNLAISYLQENALFDKKR